MQTDHSVLENINVVDHRNKPDAKKVEAEKTKEKTPEKKMWDESSKERVFNRMFPNAKENEAKKEEKPGDKAGDKKKTEDSATTSKTKTAKETATGQSTGQNTAAEKVAEDAEKETETAPPARLKPTAKKEAQEVDYEKLATSVATATAKAITESSKASATAKAEDDVPEARREDLAAIEYLEKNNPKYKGKAAEYKKFAREEDNYISKWEKDNHGRKFDARADEHNEWYDAHEPEIEPRDVERAHVRLEVEKIANEIVEKKTSGTTSEVEQLRLERDVERAVERAERALPAFNNRNIALVGSAMGEEVAQAMAKLKGGESLEETDPAAHMTLMQILPELQEQTAAATRIFGTEGRAYNGKDPAHKAVFDAALELEGLLLAQPSEKLKDGDGRTYAKLDEWAAMTPEQKSTHWTIGPDLMTEHLGNKAAQKAEQNYKTEREKVEKIAKAYGYSKNGAPQTARTEPAHEREETEQEQGKTRSPSTSTRTVIQPGTKVTPQTAQDGVDRVLNKMFGR